MVPTQMLPIDRQRSNEYHYSRKHIDTYIHQAIRDNPEMEERIAYGVVLLEQWLSQSYYPAKEARLAQLVGLDLEALTRDLLVGIAYCQTPETFVSITSQLAGRIGFDDKRDSIITVAEIVAVLCHTDAFDILKADRNASLMIQSRIPLPEAILEAVYRSVYVPPMVCQPNTVTSNYESGYLTFNESLVLGAGNSHEGDLCLDVINLQNSIPLRLNKSFLSTVKEDPTHVLDSLDKQQQWAKFAADSQRVYALLDDQPFWLTNKPDKRGRLYACGYHVNTQGTSYKKAMIELAEAETIEVPEEHKTC